LPNPCRKSSGFLSVQIDVEVTTGCRKALPVFTLGNPVSGELFALVRNNSFPQGVNVLDVVIWTEPVDGSHLIEFKDPVTDRWLSLVSIQIDRKLSKDIPIQLPSGDELLNFRNLGIQGHNQASIWGKVRYLLSSRKNMTSGARHERIRVLKPSEVGLEEAIQQKLI
jgi:hypothetical protein